MSYGSKRFIGIILGLALFVVGLVAVIHFRKGSPSSQESVKTMTTTSRTTGSSVATVAPKMGMADVLKLIEDDPAHVYVNAKAQHLNDLINQITNDSSLNQNLQQQEQSHFQQELSTAQRSLWNDIQYAAAQVAKAEHLDLIVADPGVDYMTAKPVDVTQKIIDVLNKEYGSAKNPEPLHPDAPTATGSGDGTLDGVAVVNMMQAISSDPLAQTLQADLTGSDQTAQQKAVAQLTDRFRKALDAVAKAQHLSVVVEQSAGILYADGSTQGDVTPDVQAILQKS